MSSRFQSRELWRSTVVGCNDTKQQYNTKKVSEKDFETFTFVSTFFYGHFLWLMVTVFQSTVGKKMVAVHFTTMPCLKGTKKANFFTIFVPVVRTLCNLGLKFL